MKILFICDEYPPGKNGGIGTTVQNLGRELVKQGHSVFVAGLYGYRYREKDFEVDNGVKVWRMRYGINLRLSSHNKLYTVLERQPDFVKRNLKGKTAFKKYLDFIQDLIRKENIDVIEIADFNSFAMYIGFTVQWPEFNVPLVLKSHGSYTYFCHELGETADPKFEKTDRLLFERADAISCVSNYTAGIDHRIYDLKQNIKVLYNGIPQISDVSEGNKKKNTVVFTGTLVYKKGIFSLLKAWNLVINEMPDVKLLVFGKGNTKKLSRLLNEKSLPTVSFQGHVSRTQLFGELKLAKLAVFPSYSETFGMGVVEAMSVGCPVIYTKRSCGPEIVKDGVEGLLIDPDNIEELAESILSLLRNEKLGLELAKNALLAVKDRFNIEKSAVDNVAFYNAAIIDFKQKHKK